MSPDRQVRPRHERARYVERRERRVEAPPDLLWEVVAAIGGDVGYYAFTPLWRLRAAADRLVGGPGLRGRLPGTPQPGDVVDFWRVEEADPPHRLRLRSEMRMPGTAWLGLAVEDDGGRATLVQHTWFDPWPVVGDAFWASELAAHRVVFARMCDNLARIAERRAAEQERGVW